MAVKKNKVHKDFISGLMNSQGMGRYKIIRRLGQGGSGVVYLARDSYIQRQVALKISHGIASHSRKKLFLEAQSAGRLSHPNILSIYDTGLYREFCYIIMEYLEGDTLKSYGQKDKLLPLDQCAEIVFKICKALDYAHQKGVIHRDIKPSNIMLDEKGEPKLMDFGIAHISEETSEKGIWGTPSYMSPEQLKEETTTQQSDIFSLGCVLYELLTGERAFRGENDFSVIYKITRENPEPVRNLRPDLPVIFEEIVNKALAKRLADRYASCTEFGYDLRVALRGIKLPRGDQKFEDIIDLLRQVPFFHNFTREQIESLGLAGCIIKMPKGKVIVTEGDIDDTFYVLLKGKVRIRKDSEVIAKIRAGECFGEMAYIAGQARNATATTATECLLMKINATLLDKAPDGIQLLFFKNFARTLSYRLEKSSGSNLQGQPS
ncbi:MAG: serine/threonine-protein kinase [Desulfobacterales bacterium]|nr:serine/threonine-protein kinase [Desulfobacterales bacterium]MDJ0882850.1 serine/threonine-protein kinase [Desulfobacterales bacterium]